MNLLKVGYLQTAGSTDNAYSSYALASEIHCQLYKLHSTRQISSGLTYQRYCKQRALELKDFGNLIRLEPYMHNVAHGTVSC